MLGAGSSFSDWALRRLLKVLLKRNLKGVLETEIDVEQLRVSLGAGCLELTDVLLSREWLAERAPPGLEVVSGYIGRLRLDLAVTSLTAGLQLEDVLITVRPGKPQQHKGAGGAGGAAAEQAAANAAAPAAAAGFGIDEGVRLVAAGVETLLQRMTVTVTRLSVRAELPAAVGGGGAAGAGNGDSLAATLFCAQLTYGAAQDRHAVGEATIARRVGFTGLSLTLELPADAGGASLPGQAGTAADSAPAAASAASAPAPLLSPLDGEAEVSVSWPLDRLPGHQPHVSVSISLEALHLQLRPPDVAGLLALGRGFADAHTRAAAVAAAAARQQLHSPAPAAAAAVAAAAAAAPAHPHHSLIDDLMLPECEALVQDALLESVAAAAEGAGGVSGEEGEADEFFDAKSLLGSLQQAFSSAMTGASYCSAASTGSVAPGLAGSSLAGGAGLPADADLDAFAMHDLAASIREGGGGRGKQWSSLVRAPALTLSLLYPDGAGCTSPHYAPRLVAELSELEVAAEATTDAASAGRSGGSLSVCVGVVEVAEHLPFPSQPSPASSAASSAFGTGWLPAEEMARVPAVLPAPPSRRGRWPMPTSAGDYPLPEPASGAGLGGTLAQLSDLSQATVYQSAAALEGSTLMRSFVCEEEAAAVPRVQIVPVLLCSGEGAALGLHRSSYPPEGSEDGEEEEEPRAQQTAAGPSAGSEVSVMLQPVCVWCTLPLLAHLQAFGAAVAHHLAAAANVGQLPSSGQAGRQQQGAGSKAAVAAAIQDILQQQRLEESRSPAAEQPAAPLRLSIFLPAACLVVAVPAGPGSAGLAGGIAGPPVLLPKYFAAEVQGCSSQLLASMGPRMGVQQPQALIASLRDSGVQPMLVLQQGGSLDAGCGKAAAPTDCAWACALRTGSVCVHAVGEAAGELGDSVLGGALAAAPLASIAGESEQRGGGITIQGCWREQQGDEQALPRTGDAGWQPSPAELWEQLSSQAPLLVSARAGAPVRITLERGTLAAAGCLADGLLQLSAAEPPPEVATPAVVQLECDVHCTLAVPSRQPPTLSLRSLHAVSASGIGRVTGSSVASLAVGGVELTRPEPAGRGKASTRLLAHTGGQQQSDGRRLPALQACIALRPTGEPCVLSSSGRYVLPCRGRVAASSAGLTLVLDESGQLDWAADLRAFAAGSSAAAGAGAVGAADGPAPPAPALDFSLLLTSSSLRYEPRDPKLAAAVLSAASISWQAPHGGAHSTLQARRLALLVAAAAGNGGGSSSSDGLELQGAVPAGLADVAGFHQVATEAGLTVQLPGASLPAAAAAAAVAAAAEGQAAVRETVVTNRGLSITLSRHTLLLLQRLARQLPAKSGSSRAPAGSSAAARSGQAAVGLGGSGGLAGGSSYRAAGMAPSPSAGGGGVNVLAGVVQSEYVSPRRPAEHPLEASVFLDGGWYDPQQPGQQVMSPAGSPPAVVDRGFLRSGGPGGGAAEEEAQGVWYGGGEGGAASQGLLDFQEDYVALQAPSDDEEATSPASPSYDCRLLPPGQAPPVSRVSLHELSITLTLADTFATVLLPEDEQISGGSSSGGSSRGGSLGEEDLELELEVVEEPAAAGPQAQQQTAQQQRGASSRGSSRRSLGAQGSAGSLPAAAQGDGEEEEVVVPLSAQVQARLEGVCLQLDRFAAPQEAAGQPGSAGADGAASAPLHARYALLVRSLEVRDSFQPRQGGAAGGGSAPATGWGGLRRMLGYHASLHRPVRDAKASMVQAVVEAVHAGQEPGAELEYRMHVQLLPLLLHLDQAALAFLQHLFAPADDASSPAAPPPGSAGRPGSPDTQGGGEAFFQRCEVQPFTLTINYRPHRVDLAALSSGQLGEVLNLVPWGGVSLHFRHLRLFGMQGLGGVGTAVASAYVEDIARHQAHSFVRGIAPIKSICRVSAAAAQLVAIPRQQLYKHSSGGGGGLSLSALADEDFRRQMQRGLAGFVRAVALEAVNLGATVAAGAEVALAGESSASHTVGVKKALRQASAHLRSSTSGPRTAASAAATAVRTALLGVRNTLDKEHALERRLNS